MTAAAVPAVAAINLCRSSTVPTRPTPPTLPKNDTARSPQRLGSWLVLPATRDDPIDGIASTLITGQTDASSQREFRANIYQTRKLCITAAVRPPMRGLRVGQGFMRHPAGCHDGMTTMAAMSDRPITKSADILHSAVSQARARTYNAQITEPFRHLIRHVRFWQYFRNKLPLTILYGCLEKISVVLRTTPLSWSNVIAWERVEHVLRKRRFFE